MSRPPLLVIAAGGTGGHMFPAQALAEAMLRKGWRIKLSTDERGARYTGGFPHVVEIEQVVSATFARGGFFAKISAPFRIGLGAVQAVWSMLFDRPDLVIGFGGYPSVPALAAATLLRCKRMIHEQNGVLGRVNQIFARRVHAIACGTWPTELPEGVQANHTGNPVRAAVMKREGAPYIPPGDYPMTLLVMGGSQGAQILSDIVPQAIVKLPETILLHLRISHQARPEDLDRVSRFYRDNGINADVQEFFQDLPSRMSEAQLVISRAGASSVADISVIGRPSILVPLAAAIRDEQSANARTLVDANAAVLIPESLLEVDSLAEHIRAVMENPDAAVKMAHAALATGRPDATERLVEMVETLSGRRPAR